MKKLEELGISPAPWTVPPIDNDFVHDSNGESVCQVNMIAEDAPLIAAAPELYKWLAFAVEHYKCETRSCDNCPNGKCWVVDATAALAKAAGKNL